MNDFACGGIRKGMDYKETRKEESKERKRTRTFTMKRII